MCSDRRGSWLRERVFTLRVRVVVSGIYIGRELAIFFRWMIVEMFYNQGYFVLVQ